MPTEDVPKETLRAFVEQAASEGDRELSVDDATWADLDMDAVWARLDRCRSTPGSMALYGLLRSPMRPSPVLAERAQRIEALTPNGRAAAELEPALSRLGSLAGAADLASLLWVTPPEPLPYPWLYPTLMVLAVASLPLAFALGGPAIFAPIVAFAVNAGVHFRLRVRWQAEMQALRFLGLLRGCARTVTKGQEPLLEGHRKRIADVLRATSRAGRRVALLSSGDIKDILYEYANILLLLELQAYQWVAARWTGLESSMRNLFLTVGELDALASVARWRSEIDCWCVPEVVEGDAAIEIAEGVHPLLDRPVPNSLALTTRGCIVTGANMSGKSTLLRTLGINALLAHTILTCTARRYRASPLRVVASMRVADDVQSGKSRYLAEAERLLSIVRRADRRDPTLCLIDELLSGTNAVERLAASRAILDYLARCGALVVAATHDLELTEELGDRFDSVFFADDFTRDDLAFDHRLRRGVATTRNAIRLLERLGFPDEVVAEARRVASRDPA